MLTVMVLIIFMIHNCFYRSREGKLQVEMARARYQLPRLSHMWTHLERQSQTASGSGSSSKGMGEKQLEVDKRLLRAHIAGLRKEINEVRSQRMQHRRRRRENNMPIISLVGYTNAGKSTLMQQLILDSDRKKCSDSFESQLIDSNDISVANSTSRGIGRNFDEGHVSHKSKLLGSIVAEDKLFATLDPVTRRFTLQHEDVQGTTTATTCLVSDTVGFIRKLPTSLIAAFRATLEEINDATLLIHVVDASSKELTMHARVVEQVLASIDVDDIPMITGTRIIQFKKKIVQELFVTN